MKVKGYLVSEQLSFPTMLRYHLAEKPLLFFWKLVHRQYTFETNCKNLSKKDPNFTLKWFDMCCQIIKNNYMYINKCTWSIVLLHTFFSNTIVHVYHFSVGRGGGLGIPLNWQIPNYEVFTLYSILLLLSALREASNLFLIK